jgi:hypothetical protein
MCDRLPSKNRRELAADVPQRARDVSASRQRLTVDDLRRLAEACRDLVDPVVMARAWGDPDDTREGMRAANSMHETAPTMRDPRKFGGSSTVSGQRTFAPSPHYPRMPLGNLTVAEPPSLTPHSRLALPSQ